MVFSPQLFQSTLLLLRFGLHASRGPELQQACVSENSGASQGDSMDTPIPSSPEVRALDNLRLDVNVFYCDVCGKLSD